MSLKKSGIKLRNSEYCEARSDAILLLWREVNYFY